MRGAERELLSLIRAAPQDPAGFREACGRVTDWERLIDCAIAEGVAGVIHTEAGKAGVVFPADAARKLEWRAGVQRLHHAWLRRALIEVLRAFADRGVRVACLKGPALAERLYEDPELRPSADIDLLIADADFRVAIEVLAGVGWRAEGGRPERFHRRDRHDVELMRKNAPTVELHFRAMTGFGTVVPSEDLLTRARPHRLDGIDTLVLSAEDEMIYLALHAAWHLLGRVLWLYDLKLLVLGRSDLSWDTVCARARALRVETALAFTLERVRDLDVPIPALGREPTTARAWATERVRRVVLDTPAPLFCLTGFQTLLCDSAPAAAVFLAQGLVRMARVRAQKYLPWVGPSGTLSF
ncbi:MAG: nucleotidyltransferase family protein [Candidatus Binatia bacterium]